MTNEDTSDDALIKQLPGFENGYADLYDVRLHYVAGGRGTPLFLIGGWPQTWWEFHHIMPALAQRYRVVAVDMRGQGGSSRPDSGYDKKTMAGDIHALARSLGHEQINICGHDIGAMVAYSFLANYPDATLRAALLDIPHPFPAFLTLPLLPASNAFDGDIRNHSSHPWWFAFNSVPDLAEKLLEGRVALLLNWIFDYLAYDRKAITAFDRSVYIDAYGQPGAMRAGNATYKAFRQDIEHLSTYPKTAIPVLGMHRANNALLPRFLSDYVPGAKVIEVKDSGHWLAEEQPAQVITELLDFFG